MVERSMPRIQDVIFPPLRAALPDVEFTSWIPNAAHRRYPLVNIRRLSGLPIDVRRLDRPVIEITVLTRDGVIAAENLYLDVRTVLWDMVQYQTVTEHGYLHSFFETFAPTLFDSAIEDTWRVQGLIQLGLRPAK